MRKVLLLLGIAATVLASLPLARASLMREMELAELTATAEHVVVADVSKIESQWDSNHRNIVSTIEVRVQESWKGSPPPDGKIRLQQLGGSVGEIEMTVVGMPKFDVGERALLFLRGVGVVGMGQGKRPLRWNESGKRWFAEPADPTGVIRLDQNGRLRATPGSTGEPLDSLRAKVRALVESPAGI